MNKDFDAVSFMRTRREQIEQEDAGLSWQEKSRKTLRVLEGDPLWEKVKNRLVPAGGQAPSKEKTRLNPGALSSLSGLFRRALYAGRRRKRAAEPHNSKFLVRPVLRSSSYAVTCASAEAAMAHT